MSRAVLPNRRATERRAFEHNGVAYTAGVARFTDGRLAEIFLSLRKPGGALDDLSRDVAIVASLALQFGCPASVLRHALTRSANGSAAGPLGTVLDTLAAEDDR